MLHEIRSLIGISAYLVYAFILFAFVIAIINAKRPKFRKWYFRLVITLVILLVAYFFGGFIVAPVEGNPRYWFEGKPSDLQFDLGYHLAIGFYSFFLGFVIYGFTLNCLFIILNIVGFLSDEERSKLYFILLVLSLSWLAYSIYAFQQPLLI